MSVTIVSSLPTPAQAASATENTSSASTDTTAASQGFASLLFGQMIPLTANLTSETPPEKKSAETGTTEADTTNLLSALGIIPPEVIPVANTTTAKTSDLLTAVKTDKNASAPLQLTSSTPSPKASAETTATTLESAALTAADDKPAKLAVAAPTVPVVENSLLKNAPAETPSTLNVAGVSSQSSNLNMNALQSTHATALSVATPVRDQNWTNDFSQKIVWLAGSDKQSAQITLNPPQMGPIEVSLNMDKSTGSATASFVSANAEVRNAIETALPRLREMFASAGIDLGQTNVSSQSFQQQAGNSEGKSGSSQRTNDNAILVTSSAGSLPIRAFTAQQGNGFVDIFA